MLNPRTLYTRGGTVQASGGFYIQRPADDELLQLCRAGDFASVLAAQQMGKSSLITNTAQALAAEGIASAILDLNTIGTSGESDMWYRGLLMSMADQLGLETDVPNWWQTHSDGDISQRLTQFVEKVLLAEVEAPVVIFVDDIETPLRMDQA